MGGPVDIQPVKSMLHLMVMCYSREQLARRYGAYKTVK